jgi:hypothetical protein
LAHRHPFRKRPQLDNSEHYSMFGVKGRLS